MATPAESGCAALPLETERLVLRAPCAGDAAALVALLADGRVAATTGRIPHPYGRADAEAWLAAGAAGAAGGETARIVVERGAAVPVGAVSHRARSGGVHDIGCWIGTGHQGRGFASEAAARVVRHLFGDAGARAVTAATLPANGAACRVLEKLGMRRTGTALRPAAARGRAVRLALYRLDRAGWLAAHALPVVLVAAAALVDGDGRVLLARRPPGRAMAGLWEFPGGKVAAGETPEMALIRELREELGIDTRQSCLAPAAFASHRYDDFHLLMPLYVCRVWHGAPAAREGQRLAWVRPARLADYDMPPADAPLVAQLRDLL